MIQHLSSLCSPLTCRVSSGGGSLFTNSNWFADEDERIDNEHSTDPVASSSPNIEGHMDADDVTEKDEEELADATISKTPESNPESEKAVESDKTPEWVEWRECSDSIELSPTSTDTPDTSQFSSLPNGELMASEAKPDDVGDPPSSAPQSAEVDESEGDRRGKEGEEESSEKK